MADQRELQGVLFRNVDRPSEKHPVYSGKATVGGVEYRVAGWINEPKGGAGEKYMALRFTEIEPETAAAPDAPDDPDSDLPF